MSWGNYNQGPDGYRPVPGSDPYDRAYDSSEPSGYVTHDPYAVPGYNQPGDSQSGYGQPGYHQHLYGPTYRAPLAFGCDVAHPPRPSVGLLDAVKLYLKNYAVFHGRASRSEFWWVFLAGLILTVLLLVPAVVLAVVSSASSYGSGFSSDPGVGLVLYVMFVMIISLGLVVPTLSLQVRRLHDAGFSGFFSIFSYVPYLNSIGWLVPFVMSFFPSRPEGVKYDNPNGSQPASI